MNDVLLLIISCALLGSVVGFLAGLLGIGGGLIIVPVLSSLLLNFQIVEADQVIVVAIATSLASILFTSTSSALAHHRNDNIPWQIAPWVMGGVALGALLSGFFAAWLPEQAVRIIFCVSVIAIALRMIFSKSHQEHQKPLPSGGLLGAITTLMGSLSAMIGIGGGALIVPLLSHFSVDMKKAIGCAAACGIVIALFGSVGYVSSGWQHFAWQNGFAGFVYLPALFGIIVTSWFMAPLGAKATQHWPVKVIKRIFAALLVVIAIRMLMS
ncbi:sulfite exporter TauE/SafE family protein [Pseudoalteromonas fenneropenaei]|uniref:Probable membrane transporter protein n=1 Tax=Pseudoalteromonas fenneropenaei TaxID=1737459 RepID=A0ABV7CH17_9GAMM